MLSVIVVLDHQLPFAPPAGIYRAELEVIDYTDPDKVLATLKKRSLKVLVR